MIVEVVRSVPGLVEGRYLTTGDTADLANGIAVSLINDGYLKPAERQTEAETVEKAVEVPNRRGRKTT